MQYGGAHLQVTCTNEQIFTKKKKKKMSNNYFIKNKLTKCFKKSNNTSLPPFPIVNTHKTHYFPASSDFFSFSFSFSPLVCVPAVALSTKPF